MKWQRQKYVLNDGTETLEYVSEQGDHIIKWPTMLSRGLGKPRGQWIVHLANGKNGGCWTTLKEAKEMVTLQNEK